MRREKRGLTTATTGVASHAVALMHNMPRGLAAAGVGWISAANAS
ncbi:MAG: hypothetical protein QOE60_2823, partial [Thermoleophilaceae bacterium]|nr:hypothetical protein [Thermoleophilaceae bacterium]